MSSKLEIEIMEDGPYKMSNVDSLEFNNEPQDITNPCFLCRCGESKKAPYCDGSHGAAGFVGKSKPLKKQDIIVWEGKKLKTYFNPNICMHARYCAPLGELRKKEGDDGSTATAEKIVFIANKCPSGAVSYEKLADFTEKKPNHENRVSIRKGGEIRIQAESNAVNFDLSDRQDSDKITLCRCGKSLNKPFCDAQHEEKKGFV